MFRQIIVSQQICRGDFMDVRLTFTLDPLNEEKAIQAAADLLGELFLFMASVLDLNSE
jgi:hypothetical protein